jgi:hypothetical protein
VEVDGGGGLVMMVQNGGWRRWRVVVVVGTGKIDVRKRGREHAQRLSPRYSWAHLIAGAPRVWFAGDNYTPGEPNTWCAGNKVSPAIPGT